MSRDDCRGNRPRSRRQDYLLSTRDRRPENETPDLDPAKFPGNAYVASIARARAAGPSGPPKPLYDGFGAYLQQSFAEIEARWGSVDAYLDQILGVDKAAIARLRAIYLQ